MSLPADFSGISCTGLCPPACYTPSCRLRSPSEMATMMARSKVGVFRPASGQQAARIPPPPARQAVLARSTGWADPSATTAERAMFGENFGARDPFAAEIESNFSDKVLGNYNTDHIIKVPTGMASFIGLNAKKCVLADQAVLLPEKELNLLKQQVPGWKVITNKAGQQALRHEWRLRSTDAAAQLQGMINEIGATEGHNAEVTVQGDMLFAELTSSAAGGLTENDFIIASRVNQLELKELLPPPRKRFWA